LRINPNIEREGVEDERNPSTTSRPYSFMDKPKKCIEMDVALYVWSISRVGNFVNIYN
jgi:hypothetical protein